MTFRQSKGVPQQSQYQDDLVYKRSLLEQQLTTIVIVSFSCYAILQLGLSACQKIGIFTTCEKMSDIPEWLRVLNFGSSFAFLSNSILQLCFAAKHFSGGVILERPLFAMHTGVLTVLAVSGASHYQTYVFQDFVCVDGFG